MKKKNPFSHQGVEIGMGMDYEIRNMAKSTIIKPSQENFDDLSSNNEKMLYINYLETKHLKGDSAFNKIMNMHLIGDGRTYPDELVESVGKGKSIHQRTGYFSREIGVNTYTYKTTKKPEIFLSPVFLQKTTFYTILTDSLSFGSIKEISEKMFRPLQTEPNVESESVYGSGGIVSAFACALETKKAFIVGTRINGDFQFCLCKRQLKGKMGGADLVCVDITHFMAPDVIEVFREKLEPFNNIFMIPVPDKTSKINYFNSNHCNLINRLFGIYQHLLTISVVRSKVLSKKDPFVNDASGKQKGANLTEDKKDWLFSDNEDILNFKRTVEDLPFKDDTKVSVDVTYELSIKSYPNIVGNSHARIIRGGKYNRLQRVITRLPGDTSSYIGDSEKYKYSVCLKNPGLKEEKRCNPTGEEIDVTQPIHIGGSTWERIPKTIGIPGYRSVSEFNTKDSRIPLEKMIDNLKAMKEKPNNDVLKIIDKELRKVGITNREIFENNLKEGVYDCKPSLFLEWKINITRIYNTVEGIDIINPLPNVQFDFLGGINKAFSLRDDTILRKILSVSIKDELTEEMVDYYKNFFDYKEHDKWIIDYDFRNEMNIGGRGRKNPYAVKIYDGEIKKTINAEQLVHKSISLHIQIIDQRNGEQKLVEYKHIGLSKPGWVLSKGPEGEDFFIVTISSLRRRGGVEVELEDFLLGCEPNRTWYLQIHDWWWPLLKLDHCIPLRRRTITRGREIGEEGPGGRDTLIPGNEIIIDDDNIITSIERELEKMPLPNGWIAAPDDSGDGIIIASNHDEMSQFFDPVRFPYGSNGYKKINKKILYGFTMLARNVKKQNLAVYEPNNLGFTRDVTPHMEEFLTEPWRIGAIAAIETYWSLIKEDMQKLLED